MRRGWGPIKGAEEKVLVSETCATRVEIRNSRRREAVCRRQGTARETTASMSAWRSDCAVTFHRKVGEWPVRESCETSPLEAVASQVPLQSPLGSSWSVISSPRVKATPLPSKAQQFAGAVLWNSEWPLPRCARACSGRSHSCADTGPRSHRRSGQVSDNMITSRTFFYLIERTGAPGWNRTSDPQLRRLMLYPTELRARVGKTRTYSFTT